MCNSVLHICAYSANYKGNFIESLNYLAKKDTKRKHIYLFSENSKRTNASNWIKEINNNGVRAYIQKESFWGNIILLKKIVKENNVSCVVRHFSDGKIDLILKLFFPNIKIIRFFHSSYNVNFNSLRHKINKIIYKNNILVGVGESVLDQCRTMFPENKTLLIENAIFFKRLDKDGDVKFPEKQGSIALLTMGYNIFIKGTDLAIEAVEKIRKTENAVLYIVVAASMDSMTNYLKEKYAGVIPSWIVLLQPTENIGTYYRNVDIFLSPSRTEGLVYSIMESAYCCNSIVASRINGQAEIRVNGIYWHEKENVEDLTQKIRIAISELKTEEKIIDRKQVAIEVQKEYSLEIWSDKFIALIDEIA